MLPMCSPGANNHAGVFHGVEDRSIVFWAYRVVAGIEPLGGSGNQRKDIDDLEPPKPHCHCPALAAFHGRVVLILVRNGRIEQQKDDGLLRRIPCPP